MSFALLMVGRDQVRELVQGPAVQAWFTIFVSICLQAMPFLVFGVVLSGLLTAFVPPGAIARRLPKRGAMAVPVAGLAGMALPGCECASVPLAGRLVDNRVPAAATLTFLLAAPAINPIVLVATSVAFPGQPEMVVARFLASLVAAVVVGWIWVRIGKDSWLGRSRHEIGSTTGRWQVFAGTATHDLLHTGGYLILGGVTAATLQVVVPRSILDSLGGSGILAVASMATLAVVLSVCSEADAFVVAGLTPVLADVSAGLPGRRSDGGPQAHRHAVRRVRTPVHGPVRSAGVRRRGDQRRRRGVGAAVSREARALILTSVALLLLRLSITGEHVLFVKPAMGPFLLVAGAVVAVLAVCVMLAPESRATTGPWRAPARLVAHGAARRGVRDRADPARIVHGDTQPQRAVADPGSGKQYRLPPAVDGAVDLTVAEINQHGLYDVDEHMKGARLRVDGFVVPDSDGPGGTFLLTRFVLSCCAADAYPMSLRISGVKHASRPRHLGAGRGVVEGARH